MTVLLAALAGPALAQDGAFACPALVDPVIRLDHGSRYTATDKSRSAFDTASNAEVNAQLKPVDDFVSDMSAAANASRAGSDAAAACVVAGLAAWAEAGALQQMDTPNASMSVPSRLAGLAMAWAQVKPRVAPGPEVDLIETWFAGLATSAMTFFDTEAPPKSARNNLRAWAALAAAQVGLIRQDKVMTDWADASVQLVACGAAPDGSLTVEMGRKELALHYQMHAVTALVTTAALLQTDGRALFEACDRSLHRMVRFSVAAFADPGAVTKLAGVKQSYFDGSDDLQGFELAWATPYLALFLAPDLAALVEPFGALTNSKLGGDQAVVWQTGLQGS